MKTQDHTARFSRRATLFVAFVLFVMTGHAQTQQPAAATAKPASAAAPSQAAVTAGIDPTVVRLESFVVTGIRAGIESAIEAKRDNTSIVETITSEDIGKLQIYACGWDNQDNRAAYRDMRHDSNSFLSKSRTATSVILLNHLVSALLAARGATKHNLQIAGGLELDWKITPSLTHTSGRVMLRQTF